MINEKLNSGVFKVVSKIFQILNSKQKTTAVYVFALMLLGMVLETIGVGVILPLITLLQDPLKMEKLERMLPEQAYQTLASLSSESRITIVMLAISLFFIFKNTFLACLSYQQSRFSFGIQSHLSQKLFIIYLTKPYRYHLERNSAQLIRNVTTEVNAVTFNLVLPILYICSECLIVLGLAVLLFSIEPIGALAALGVLSIAGFLFHLATTKHIHRCGKARQYHEGQRIQHLQQALGAIKEVKLLGCESEFLSRFKLHAEEYSHAGRVHVTLQQLPRLWVELLAILGLFFLIFTMLAQGRSMDTLIPTLGLFAAAAFRLMPSCSRILTYLQNIKFATPVIDLLHAEICEKSHKKNKETKYRLPKTELNGNLLEIRNLSYRYPSRNDDAIKNISLAVREFETIGICGSSGSGKTTLIDLILGLLKPEVGKILNYGNSIFNEIEVWQKMLGYVPQSIFLIDDTILRNIAFGVPDDLIDMNSVWNAVKSAKIFDFIKELPDELNTNVGERGVKLSGGQQQRIGLARALYHRPKVLVLDEATSALDSNTEESVMNAISALHGRITIIIVAHRLSTFEYCDTVIRLENGQIQWSGKYSEFLEKNLLQSSNLAEQK